MTGPAFDRDELARHRISAVRTIKLRTRWPRLLGRNARLEEHGYGVTFLVRQIVTDGGATGWGVCRRLGPGRTPDLAGRSVAELFDPDRGVVAPEARPLDLALHDLAGVILGVPVHRMVGPAGERAVEVYAGMTYMDDITPAYVPGGVKVVVENCRQDYDAGYRGFKVKIARGYRWMDPAAGLTRDIEVTRAVRESFPDCHVLVDANDGYDCDGFLQFFQAVADCHLQTIEEPFPENRDDLLRLRELIDKLAPGTTVTDGESRPDPELLLSLVAEGLVDILNLDIEGFGLTPLRALAPEAIARGALLSPHTFSLGLKTNCAAHFLAGVGHAAPLEGVRDETEGVDTDAFRPAEGFVTVPETPGFGMKLIWGREYGPNGRDSSGYPLMM